MMQVLRLKEAIDKLTEALGYINILSGADLDDNDMDRCLDARDLVQEVLEELRGESFKEGYVTQMLKNMDVL
ncbi:MAG: hypothetical protein Q7O66_00805 [Dehalococcoidia bacterium]|nr:hypothetical protein [Dehalococcoidia bacterium]